MAVLEDAEHEALPWFHMERAIEKGAALDNLAVDGDRQGVMPRGGQNARPGDIGEWQIRRSSMRGL